MAIRISSSRREVEHRRELFIAAYAATGNATAAAVAAGFSEKTAGTQGDALLHEPATGLRAREARRLHVQDTLGDFARQQAALRAAADGAIAALAEIVQAAPRDAQGKPDRTYHLGAIARVQAAVAILDRAGHKPVERIEAAVQWEDVSRELAEVDVSLILREALDSISNRPDALPGPEEP